ncbi:Predicted ATP-dependent protease [Methylobacillus rhizosphaerae]|uniref:endopeptidase La n=1 Tax=Methylobacillus rhizosphaerae TaxID=551994 RepID=A0A239AYG5_9PROT|nr:AAA family ATPase [Methylobacillus rhizosphaerae]SNS00003.1 Predicted ATP-dependent protease [Methylobacillus rhizosphaerae]
MLSKLTPSQLNISIDPQTLGFSNTLELLTETQATTSSWIGQNRAFAAASTGMRMQHAGHHILVIGEPRSGRTTLIRNMAENELAHQPLPPDLVYLLNVQVPEKPYLLRLKAGKGNELRQLLDQIVRRQLRIIPELLQSGRVSQAEGQGDDPVLLQLAETKLKLYLEQEFAQVRERMQDSVLDTALFEHWIAQLTQEVLDNLDVFASATGSESDGMLEAFCGRFRANVLVNNSGLTGAPVIYDDDPSYASLFGGIESASEQQVADFMRFRAGKLLCANGGVLLLHLEDILTDQQQGANSILDKLMRVLRNRKLQIEDAASVSANAALNPLVSEAVSLDLKLILIASREDYYHLHEQHGAFLENFSVQVEFAESMLAGADAYHELARYIAHVCHNHHLPHFTAPAVARLLQILHEWEEDQARVSLQLGRLIPLLQEIAALTAAGNFADVAEVELVLSAVHNRHGYAEQQIRESILDGELVINVHGHEAGRINGLTHIDVGSAAFGSPVQISARCYPGRQGVINIDREVKMTGPQHDKGMFILQNWLAATFAQQAPLTLNASLVFEQEYHGVEGDSASCAELYALLSSLSGLPLLQGIAVTGALNQHGDVLPVGGINEKIEGHFRLCEKLGLDGQQGVLLPARNARHVLLHKDIVRAVADGKFHIYTMEHVLDGIAHLTGMPAGSPDRQGMYPDETVLGRVQHTLQAYQGIYQRNHQFSVKPSHE